MPPVNSHEHVWYTFRQSSLSDCFLNLLIQSWENQAPCKKTKSSVWPALRVFYFFFMCCKFILIVIFYRNNLRTFLLHQVQSWEELERKLSAKSGEYFPRVSQIFSTQISILSYWGLVFLKHWVDLLLLVCTSRVPEGLQVNIFSASFWGILSQTGTSPLRNMSALQIYVFGSSFLWNQRQLDSSKCHHSCWQPLAILEIGLLVNSTFHQPRILFSFSWEDHNS